MSFDTVALLAERDALRARITELEAQCESAHAAQRHAETELAQYMAWYAMAEQQHLHEQARAERAEAELAAARGRYEWLADKVLAPDYGDNDKGCVGWNIKHCKGPAWIAGDSIDKAIDAARGVSNDSTLHQV